MSRTVSGLDMGALFGEGGLVSTAAVRRAYTLLKARGASVTTDALPNRNRAVGFCAIAGPVDFPRTLRFLCLAHFELANDAAKSR